MVVQQVGRVNDQTEHKEHNKLGEPSQSVEERAGLAFAGELIIPDDESADIDREVRIALQVIRDRKDKDTGGQDHNGV